MVAAKWQFLFRIRPSYTEKRPHLLAGAGARGGGAAPFPMVATLPCEREALPDM